MTDYFTQFSCIFDVGSAENANLALGIAGDLASRLDLEDDNEPGFEVSFDPESGPGALWIHSGDYGEPEHVITFVLCCAEAFNLTGLWGFRWALTCSRPRPDGFGGGAKLIDLGKRMSVDWTDCEHWLAERMLGAVSDINVAYAVAAAKVL